MQKEHQMKLQFVAQAECYHTFQQHHQTQLCNQFEVAV